ncbi:pilus assembly protein [Rhodobacteraceae bacterium 2CG4]|uniref:Pilus assembly protein n=1 Tax=Halovulum marinum TaxID=2662447 RepID=A0A6L5YVY4_9RHOB|nr:pilus assembly protein [Halovulum marinum]MSU88387.1 pilus assembly protein [Halovulum marinum]
MRLFDIARNLRQRAAEDEDAAVTVDWVVLTASIVTIGLVAISVIRGGVYATASDIYTKVRSSTQ